MNARGKWETQLLAMLLHLHCDDLYTPNDYSKSYEAFTRLPGQEGVTADEFRALIFRDGRRGVGAQLYVIASPYPGGGFRGAEKICYRNGKSAIYCDLEEAQQDCGAMNEEYESAMRADGRPLAEGVHVYHVFAINAFACQVRQIDQEGDFD